MTEHDRDGSSAPLVLSAATLGIPTCTLLHGMPGENCLNFYPVLADTILCWGEMFADMFRAAGVEPERIRVTGCPRLTRELPLSPAEARTKLGLDPAKPVVLLATQTFASWESRLKLAETFCGAAQGRNDFSGIVRLHPADSRIGYSKLAARFPSVRFMANEECDLDTALAATDVAVVHSSGFGSDALVKRRLAVVLDVLDEPLGHGGQLIALGGVPRAASRDELVEYIEQLLFDSRRRAEQQQRAEQYVQRFSAFFGDEAAAKTAEAVLDGMGPNCSIDRFETT